MSDDSFKAGPALSVIPYGERINPFPTHVDKLMESPCKKHPESGEKCVLHDYSKKNVYCPCGHITGNTRHIFSQKEMLFNLMNNSRNVFRRDIKMSTLFHIYDPEKGENQVLPSERKFLVVSILQINEEDKPISDIPINVIGYMMRKEDRTIIFKTPIKGIILSWCDCLPKDFTIPIYNFQRKKPGV